MDDLVITGTTSQAAAAPASSSGEDDIFTALGAQNIPDEEKEALLSRMLQAVQDRVMDKVYDQLTPEDRQALIKMMEAPDPDPEAVEAFIKERVPGYEDLYESEARVLREELIQSLAKE